MDFFKIDQQVYLILDNSIFLFANYTSKKKEIENTDFVTDFSQYCFELKGSWGFKALKTFKHMDYNTSISKYILEKWKSINPDYPVINNILSDIENLYKLQLNLQTDLSSCDPTEIQKFITVNSMNLTKEESDSLTLSTDGKRNKKPNVKLLLPIIVPLIAIIAYKIWGVNAMIAVGIIGIIIYFGWKSS